jgi:hypothetical protein
MWRSSKTGSDVAEDGTVRTWLLNGRDLLRLAEMRLPMGRQSQKERALIERVESSR